MIMYAGQRAATNLQNKKWNDNGEVMMNKVNIMDCSDKLHLIGRVYNYRDQELFFNWTCAGIRFCFEGSCLIAQLNAYCGEEMDRDRFGTIQKRTLWPYVAVFVDDNEEPVRCFEVNNSTKNYLLFSSDSTERHVITLRKITENPKGKLSISQFIMDGNLMEAKEEAEKLKLEFIGDSITCGFGNMSKERDHLFYSVDENGWYSHAAIAARKLDADFSIIAYSGIAVTRGLGRMEWPVPVMPALYPYTDSLIEEFMGEETREEWNAKQFQPDVIVVNLGTNDAAVIDFNGDITLGVQKFEEDYYQFLKMIREKNGREPWVICALGSMDYYLYDNITRVAETFSRDFQDKKLSCFKYGKMRIMDGYGALGHPGRETQESMGMEIANYISTLLNTAKAEDGGHNE